MRLEESEVLLPAMMYVFLCFVGASEHAMFSGMDTLSESREDRWYRRAEKSWRDAQKDKKDGLGTCATIMLVSHDCGKEERAFCSCRVFCDN